jgi:uncharacterized protein (TIGR03083 family)
VDLQRNARAELTRLVAGLTDPQLEELEFPHPQGQRNVRWFCTQLLTEVAFHRWDLDHALGVVCPLDDDLAVYLLPFILDPTQPLYAQLRAPNPTSFALITDADSWIVRSTSGGTHVTRGRELDAARATIRAEAGWLALAAYGRVRIDAPAFKIDGAPATADQFAAIFGPH